MKKNLLSLVFLITILFSIVFFYAIWNKVNYPMHLKKKYTIVAHPEFIPSYKLVKITSSWFWNLVSDFYWLNSIQYIWTNAVSSEYKKYLYAMLNLITDLNPKFTYPYVIWELLLPNYNERYEKFNEDEQKKFENQSIELWIKWLSNNCDMNKVESIRNEYDLKKLWNEDKYKNPCSEPMIPYYLAYIYYWNKFDWSKSSEYYRITSANEDAPKWSRVMAAIMQGKSWSREKSIMMFLSLAESIWWKESQQCKEFSNYLWWLIYQGINNKAKFNSQFIKEVDWYRKKLISDLNEIKKDDTNEESQCSYYLNKAVREMNMAFLEDADKKFFNDNKIHAQTPEELLEKKYIDYIPLDYQISKDWHVIYYFNKDTWNWDNKVWN